MKRFTTLVLLSLGCYLSSGLVGCNSSSTNEPPMSSSSPTVSATASTIAGSPSPSAATTATGAPNTQVTKPSPAIAAVRPPLTVEKLKNAEYYFLAKGPVKLSNGTYEDKATKRTYTMGDVVAYGDINKDGIKDAVTTLKVTIPNQGTFSYLVAALNEAGAPKNISTEFMGPEIKVKTLKINADNSIEAVMDQYQAGDPECCPSLKITRTYKLKMQVPSPASAPPKK